MLHSDWTTPGPITVGLPCADWLRLKEAYHFGKWRLTPPLELGGAHATHTDGDTKGRRIRGVGRTFPLSYLDGNFDFVF